MDVIKMALDLGGVAAGIISVEKLINHQSIALDILPSVRSALIVACSHSRSALDSKNLQVKQYDTIATYGKVKTVCKELTIALEGLGFEALAIPAFLPIDMSEGKKGMVGPIDLRRAAVEAGIGSYGKSGLVLVKGFGPRVRLGAILTSASLNPTGKCIKSLCPSNCQMCIDGCPAKALLGKGEVDKRACGRVIFEFGLRRMMKFFGEMFDASAEERTNLLKSYHFRELWQTLVTGNYYYCFECQALCPIGKEKKAKGETS